MGIGFLVCSLMKTRTFVVLVSILFSLGFLAAPTSVLGQEAGPKKFSVSELEFSRPDSWQTIRPRSSMRKAQLKVPGLEGGDAGEVVFFYFGPGNAGGTEANIDRWYRQFQEPAAKLNTRVEKAKVGDIAVSFVHAEGTFMSGPPVGRKVAKSGYGLLGAIIEAPKGFVFIKFTAPLALVKAAEADFKTMVTAAKPIQ